MKLVIDISEEDYDDILNGEIKASALNWSTFNSIRNGTPLPNKEMTEEDVVEVLEKEKQYMLSHGGDRQAKALEIAIKDIDKCNKIEQIISDWSSIPWETSKIVMQATLLRSYNVLEKDKGGRMTNREKLIQSLQNKVDNEDTMENIECPKLRSLDDCLHENDDVHCWQCKSMWLDEEVEE